MKPSIGRIVHYVLAGFDERGPIEEWVRAAIITAVHRDGSVNLQWFGAIDVAGTTDASFSKKFVRESQTYERGCWCWPPRVE